MKTSYPCCFAARKMRSMFSTVLFSLTLWPTAAHAAPVSLRTSFCGSMKTTAVSARSNCTMCSSFSPCWWTRSVRDEREQVGVDRLRVRGGHAVRKALVGLQRSVLQQLRRQRRGIGVGNDLIVIPMHDQHGYGDLLEVVGEVGL